MTMLLDKNGEHFLTQSDTYFVIVLVATNLKLFSFYVIGLHRILYLELVLLMGRSVTLNPYIVRSLSVCIYCTRVLIGCVEF
jgi:hypothetical protein